MEEKEVLGRVEETTADIAQDVEKLQEMEREEEKEWEKLKSQLLVIEKNLSQELRALQEKVTDLQEKLPTTPTQTVEASIPIIPKQERRSGEGRKSLLQKIWNG